MPSGSRSRSCRRKGYECEKGYERKEELGRYLFVSRPMAIHGLDVVVKEKRGVLGCTAPAHLHCAHPFTQTGDTGSGSLETVSRAPCLSSAHNLADAS